jgi:hypothetical protein
VLTQLACARISSKEGQDYLKAMACAANYAWVNRSSMTFLARQVEGRERCGRDFEQVVADGIAGNPPTDKWLPAAFRSHTWQELCDADLNLVVAPVRMAAVVQGCTCRTYEPLVGGFWTASRAQPLPTGA